jgi:hypothetical protein
LRHPGTEVATDQAADKHTNRHRPVHKPGQRERQHYHQVDTQHGQHLQGIGTLQSLNTDEPTPSADQSTSLALALIALLAFSYAAWEMMGFNPGSRLMPLLAVVPGLPLAAWLTWRASGDRRSTTSSGTGAERYVLLILLIYAFAIWAFGLLVPTSLLLAWMLCLKAGMRWWTAMIYGAVILVLVLLLFDVLRGEAPTGALYPLGQSLPSLIGIDP